MAGSQRSLSPVARIAQDVLTGLLFPSRSGTFHPDSDQALACGLDVSTGDGPPRLPGTPVVHSISMIFEIGDGGVDGMVVACRVPWIPPE
jgi:hypothetical protein